MEAGREMRIGVVGLGHVGSAMERFFSRRYAVAVYDPPKRVGTREEINSCRMAVVCVPTPMAADESCDTSAVEEAAGWIECPLVLIRSTVPPGTTDALRERTGRRIVFSPEYIGESAYWTPYKFMHEEIEAPFYIFGGDPADCHEVIDLYAPIAGPMKQYRITSALAAETVKMFENEYIAWKVTWAAEMREACEVLGLAYWEVRDLWALDPRVDPMHTAAWAESRGFDGRCIPKDTLAFLKVLEGRGYRKEILAAIVARNRRACPGAYRGLRDA